MSYKTIKVVATDRYEIRLIQVDGGAYRVAYEASSQEKPTISEAITDYKTASIMFDIKLIELEGH